MTNRPKVTVLMTVRNSEAHVAKAIESILNQSFADFEFIIIDDGSTDDTLRIIKSYKDYRIRYVSRAHKGRHASLEEGVNLARGEYLAIMDSDDISMPDRLRKQVEYLDSRPDCGVISSKIKLIDEGGDFLPDWEADVLNITPAEIKKCLPEENCIANPASTGRTALFKKFGYRHNQISEDYDLWLRLLSAGIAIHKLDAVLLHYRIHPDSITQISNRQSVLKKNLNFKKTYLTNQLKSRHWGLIESKVFFSLVRLLLATYARKIRGFLRVLLLPAKRLKTNLNNTKKSRRILYILPWMSMGGAEKVALNIIRDLADKGNRMYCISTVPSTNEWRDKFQKHCIDIVEADRLYESNEIPQFIVDYVIQNKIDVVITTNNGAGYLAAEGLRMANPDIKIFDIVHGQGGKFEKGGWPLHSTPFDRLLDKRIVVTTYMKQYLIKNFKISPDKIVVIHNGIELPRRSNLVTPKEMKAIRQKFIVLWAGRLTEEKHPELVVETARMVSQKNKDVHFFIAGDGNRKSELVSLIKKYRLEKCITLSDRPYQDFRPYMAAASLLLMTSEMEGLPMVILEAFSMKIPVIAPKVGGIPELIDSSKNGYLIDFSADFPDHAAERILYLSTRPELVSELGKKGRAKVENSFSLDAMMRKYEEAIL